MHTKELVLIFLGSMLAVKKSVFGESGDGRTEDNEGDDEDVYV